MSPEFTPFRGRNRQQWREVAQVGTKLKKTVVLVGLMGAGKTAVGTALARRLGAPFLDSDAEIVKAANMTIPEIFARDGEAFFRAREAEVIARLLRAAPGVLSTGGGAFMGAANREAISELGVSVWLDAGLDLLWQRVRHKDTRPLLRTPDPYATLAGFYHERRPVYAQADLAVRADPGYSVEDMAGRVIEALKTRPDVLEAA
ncbi:shikimate kinase [Rhodovulum sulfidophilum]|uniref:shikimate kinase n=1 Tax=Rhodovulum sulfidophilum TaxID=35806 RepID=UPI00351BC5FD